MIVRDVSLLMHDRGIFRHSQKHYPCTDLCFRFLGSAIRGERVSALNQLLTRLVPCAEPRRLARWYAYRSFCSPHQEKAGAI